MQTGFLSSFMFKGNRGFAILQVLSAAAVVGVLGGTVAYLSGRSTSLSSKLRDKGSYSILKSQSLNLSQDPGYWVVQLRADSDIENCLNPDPAGPWTCPAAYNPTPADPTITNLASGGKTLSTVNLVDMNGTPIAGTASAPLYFDSNGVDSSSSACPGGNQNAQCKFQAVGYMIRDNASGDPGNVIFVRKLEQTKHTIKTGSTPLPPVYLQVDVGTKWKSTAGNGLPVGSIVPFAGASIPDGYLRADGAMVSAATYPQLCAVLGTTWGGACKLPDLSNRFLRGASSAGGVPAVTNLQSPSIPLIQAVGTFANSDAGGHQHTATGTFASANLTGTGSGVASLSGSVGGWATPWAGAGNASPADHTDPAHEWEMPPTTTTPTVEAGTITGTAVTPINFVLSTPATGSLDVPESTGTGADSETRPLNASVYYLIRTDY